jgi:hypothetical protein
VNPEALLSELTAKMSVPALQLWDLPLPPAKLEPGAVRIGSTFVLTTAACTRSTRAPAASAGLSAPAAPSAPARP